MCVIIGLFVYENENSSFFIDLQKEIKFFQLEIVEFEVLKMSEKIEKLKSVLVEL